MEHFLKYHVSETSDSEQQRFKDIHTKILHRYLSVGTKAPRLIFRSHPEILFSRKKKRIKHDH